MTENEPLIIELEKQLLQPEIRSSKKDVERLLDDDFEEFGKSGRRLNKEDVLKGLSEEKPVQFTMDSSKVVALSDDVMLITYSLIKDDCQSKSLRSSIWRCKNGKWKMFFHQGTKANSTS
ncbi:DUF4440 domain-containing protein [Guptibacillus algicola]|uniref:nuclear transport factor 2 family protein n=1 Tax=Guptibacillus algicola TaxID=225844 RepID=UPI001CD6FAD4|nr:DUF4440 domain-containing protein [Alkalihalobacillus algicola]MCA0988331.1 DUF4440 domain-containing protein [Alkalihalobacillus algicola]